MIELDKNVAEDIPNAQRIISRAGETLYTVTLNHVANGTRNTPAQLDYLGAYETALAVFRTAGKELRKAMDVLTLEQLLGAQGAPNEALQQQINDATFYSNRYALAFAGEVGLALMSAEPSTTTQLFSFGTANDKSKETDTLTAKLAATATKDLYDVTRSRIVKKETVNDDDLKEVLINIFTTWKNQCQWNTVQEIAKQRNVCDTTMKFLGYSYEKGTFKKKHNTVIVDERIMQVKKEDVIGSEEFTSTIWNNLLKLGTYSPEHKTNPYDPASVIFTYGEPGSGKTFTAHALLRSFADLMQQKGLPCWAFTHNVTDYASHYQNKTANELSALANKINSFPGVVVMYVADADTIFQSRKDPRLSAEQQQTLSVYFRMFDGTYIPKNGKFLSIMDANYLDGIDDATKSRLFDEILELTRFKTPAEFAEYAKRTLSKGGGCPSITADDWSVIGQYLFESPLSNREIGHVIKKMRRGLSVTEEMIGKPYAELVAARDAFLASMNKDVVLEGLRNYITTRAEIEQRSLESKISDDVTRFLTSLAQKGDETKNDSQE